jgi:thymidylate synthase
MSSYTIDDMQFGFLRVLADVLMTGRRVAPRGDDTYELPGVTIELTNPRQSMAVGVGRKFSRKLAYAEALQLSGGFSDPVGLVDFVPQMRKFMDANVFHGAYGPRIKDQVPDVLKRLEHDPFSRRALLQIWRADWDLHNEGLHDYPCTLNLQFFMRDGALEMHTNMRSNDVWLGLPYDIFQFTFLQLNVAHILRVPVGSYFHHANSLHLYHSDALLARDILRDEPLNCKPHQPVRPIAAESYDDLRLRCYKVWRNDRAPWQCGTELEAMEALHGSA